MIYLNEWDAFAAAGLRELYPSAFVDETSIKELSHDLSRYEQVHFFAGIGGWPEALRLARWPAGRPIWTGSCPCQPFSDAGQKKGVADPRHLWPDMFRQIQQYRPREIVGEQVASADARVWLDGVFADLEGAGYTCGAVDMPAG